MATQHQFPLVPWQPSTSFPSCALLPWQHSMVWVTNSNAECFIYNNLQGVLDLGLVLSSTPALVYAPSLLFVHEFHMGASDAMCSILITQQLFTLTTFYLCDPSCLVCGVITAVCAMNITDWPTLRCYGQTYKRLCELDSWILDLPTETRKQGQYCCVQSQIATTPLGICIVMGVALSPCWCQTNGCWVGT